MNLAQFFLALEKAIRNDIAEYEEISPSFIEDIQPCRVDSYEEECKDGLKAAVMLTVNYKVNDECRICYLVYSEKGNEYDLSCGAIGCPE